jgi:hypothetical protein
LSDRIVGLASAATAVAATLVRLMNRRLVSLEVVWFMDVVRRLRNGFVVIV